MKKLLLLMLLLLPMAAATTHAQGNYKPALNRYAEANRLLMSGQTDRRRCVIIGNSIVELWAKYHPEFFEKHHLVGRGISGQTSYQLLLRFRQDVLDLHPRVVVICCGTNDVAENSCPYNEEHTLANLRTMIELAKAHKLRVVLCSVLPADHFPWRKSVENAAAKIQHLNLRLQSLAREYGISYCNFYEALVGSSLGEMNPALTRDGVHPLPEGYEVMEPIVLKVVDKLR